MPSVSSSSVPKVFDSSTVTTPSLPTLSIASAMSAPISASPAEMEAVAAISSLVSTSLALAMSSVDDGRDGLLDAALQADRVGAGRDVAQAFADERLGEHGRGGRAVAGDVVGLLGDLLDELGADLLVRVVELDLLGDGHTVVRDRGGAPLLLEHDVATARAERHLDGVGQNVEAALEAAAGLLVESNDLCHVCFSSLPDVFKVVDLALKRVSAKTILALSRQSASERDARRATCRPASRAGTRETDRRNDERAAGGPAARSDVVGIRRDARPRPAAPWLRCRPRTRPAGPLRAPCIRPCRWRSSGRRRPGPAVDGDEAVALFSVEPLHGSVRHVLLPLLCVDQHVPVACTGARGRADSAPRAARRHTGFERPVPDTNEVTRGHKGVGATNDRRMATIPHGTGEPALGGQPATLAA